MQTKFHGENEKGYRSPLSAIFLVDYKHTDMHAQINLMVHVQLVLRSTSIIGLMIRLSQRKFANVKRQQHNVLYVQILTRAREHTDRQQHRRKDIFSLVN